MKTYTISIQVSIHRKSEAEDREISWQEALYCAVSAFRESKTALVMERIYDLIEEVYFWFHKDARTPMVKKFAPHNIACECRKCQPSFTSYWRYLKKEIKWKRDGHIA